MTASRLGISALIARLRDLEAALLNIGSAEIPAEHFPKHKIYQGRIERLERAHSRSWFGDHANTYYENFSSAPAGRSFDVEWGFVPGFSGSNNPGWRIYSRDAVKDFILDGLGDGIFYAWVECEERVTTEYSNARDQALAIIEAIQAKLNTKALSRYIARIEDNLAPYTVGDFINGRLQSTPNMTRDSEEIAKGKTVPLQVQYLAPIRSTEVNKRRAHDLANVLRGVIEAASLHEPTEKVTLSKASRVFLGHGRSPHWKDLKDFVRDRLHLEFDEFNRVSTAGVGTQERLSEMLDGCGFAFLVMAAEDLHDDGRLHARENVVHEVGLFQGRLGWRKAIVLLEEGCEEFSNIVGLGQIRYAMGNIASCFEDVRRVLEREGII